MPASLDDLFKNSTKLLSDPLPLRPPQSHQPSTVSGVGEVKDGSASPAEMRLHDTEMALIQTEDLRDEPASTPANFFPVRVNQSGGTAGDANNQATFTYIVSDLDGQILDNTDSNPIRPEVQRPIGKLIAPTSSPTDNGDPYGTAFWDENHNLKLYSVGETEATAVCP